MGWWRGRAARVYEGDRDERPDRAMPAGLKVRRVDIAIPRDHGQPYGRCREIFSPQGPA
jgi:hypothetical protein